MKVLIIRFSSLGDIVLTSLAVRCLKKQLACDIHYLTKKGFNDIVCANPYIDKVWLLDQNIAEIIPNLKKEKYDLIVDLHKNIRSIWIRWILWNIPTVSYHKANIAKWLSVYFKINRFPKEHNAIRYLNALKKYGIQDDGDGLDYFIPIKDQINIQKLNIDKLFVAIVIGAAHFTKRIPLHKLQELTTELSKKYSILIIGGKAEVEVGKQLESKNVISTCGQYSINQSASLLDQAFVVIAPDTGMMHIAAALKKPVRSIWGSTLAEFGFWPMYGSKHDDLNASFEVNGLPCRPCARFGKDHCPKGHFKCMEELEMSAIVQSIE